MKMFHVLMAVTACVILASAASAADLGGPKLAAPPAPDAIVQTVPAASCYLGGSVGMGSSVTRISDTEFAADLGSDGYVGGGELGCDMNLAGFVIGGLARYDFNNLGGSIDGTSIDAGGIWTIAAKAGFKINSGATVYALAGIAGTKVKVEAVDSASHRGWMAGAGVELAVANSPVSIFAEYNYLTLGGETYASEEGSATIDPVTHIVRVGGRLRF